MDQFYPKRTLVGWLGKASRVWEKLFIKTIVITEQTAPDGHPDTNTGWLYCKDTGATPGLYFEDDAGSVTQIATTPTALDDVGDPDAAGSITCGTYAQVITGAKTDADMFNVRGIGAFGDVSVLRVEQITGNPTDGTVLEVVAADDNVDPLVVSASNLANALVVGQNTGTVAVAGNETVAGTLAVTGVVTLTAGAVIGASKVITTKTSLTSAQVKALRATPLAVSVAPGADYMIEFIGALLILDYGSNVFTESSDNLVIEYETSGVDASAAITSNGFLTATADTITTVIPATIAGAAASSFNNLKLMLKNTGDGEIAGNAANDSAVDVYCTYRIHALGLA
jgi:hypothetical protein